MTVYLVFSSISALLLTIIFTVNLIYQATVVALNPLQLVLVGTTLEATIFLCEIPTGVVADVYSRRLSIILGVFIMGAGFILEGSIPHFSAILLGQALWGLGYTFTSGATEAWIADEVGAKSAGKAFLRGSQAGIFGGLLGTLIAMAIGSIRINLPILTGGSLFLGLGVFLIAAMPENRFARQKPSAAASVGGYLVEHWAEMTSTLRQGVSLLRGSAALVSILVIGLFFGLYSEGLDRLSTPHFLRDIGFPAWGNLQPVIWFGGMSLVSQLIGLAATELARRRVDPDREKVALAFMLVDAAALVSALVVFALAGSFALALAAYWVIGLARTLVGPYYTTWVNRHLSPDVRATVLSMSSQVDALGQIAAGPVMGVIGNRVSIRAALLTSAAILSPVLGFLVRARRVSKMEFRGSLPHIPD